VYFNTSFNLPLSKLILAGGDFSLIPSRFEPCGLVDYEASLVGNIVIGHATGGLTKVRHCAYLYEWLDVSDRAGEAEAFWWQITSAIGTYRHDRVRHEALIRSAMSIDAGWDAAAARYVDMFRYGLLVKKWLARRRALVESFVRSLEADRTLFAELFKPGSDEYGDRFDWELRRVLITPSAGRSQEAPAHRDRQA
jgi:hypothetical protein